MRQIVINGAIAASLVALGAIGGSFVGSTQSTEQPGPAALALADALTRSVACKATLDEVSDLTGKSMEILEIVISATRAPGAGQVGEMIRPHLENISLGVALTRLTAEAAPALHARTLLDTGDYRRDGFSIDELQQQLELQIRDAERQLGR